MRKKISMILIGSLSLMLLLGGCDIKFGVGNESSKASGKTTPINEEFKIGEANSIYINIDISNLSLKTYDGEDIKIVGDLGERSSGINYNIKGDTVNIEEEYSDTTGGIFSMNNSNGVSEYEILMPESYTGNLSFEYGAGTTKIQNIKVDKLTIKGGAGELNLKNVVFNNLDLSSGVGTAHINLVDKCGNIDIQGGVGETILEMEEVGGNLKVEGGIGSVEIKVPENAPIYFKTSTGIGEIDLNNVKTSNDKTYLFDLDLGVGEINIHN